MVVLEFSSQEDAIDFLEDPEIQPTFEIRHKSTMSKLVFIPSIT